ncbi:alpha/beta hydrolase [SAR202 cluster bacterium AC-647-N09_OGT_505m]|nr:alpha/beta hydrolase [SAR202 cluster bacterium AC-647-N09_OGT_505m]
MVQSKFVRVGGINMHYLEWGEPGAPDVLLVHGWTGSAQGWNYVAEQIRDRYHVIAPDHRGHGESDKPETGYRLRDFAEDMHQVVEALGLKSPLLAGNSWGGCIGTIMAADYPADISKAVLGDPVYWKMLNAFVTRLPDTLERRKQSDRNLMANLRQQGMSEEQVQAEIAKIPNFSPHAITRLLTDNRDFAYTCEDYLKRIQVPTLIIAGDSEAGGYILPEEVEYYRTIVSPMVRITRWPGVGHGVSGQEPERYVREMVGFFEE